jgi:hypothetical protein
MTRRSVMEKSEQINELAKALSEFQGEVKNVVKDQPVSVYNSKTSKDEVWYKYANLDQVFEVTRPLLSKHGLALAQFCGDCYSGVVTLENVLMHSSGQYIAKTMILPFEEAPTNKYGNKINSDAQMAGKVISYAKRYGFCSILGIAFASEDDDATPHHSKNLSTPKKGLVEKKLDTLNTLIAQQNISNDTVTKWKQKFKVSQLAMLSDGQISSIIRFLQEKVGQHAKAG